MLPYFTVPYPCGCYTSPPCACWVSILAPPAAPRRPGPLSPPVQIYGRLIIWEL